VVAGRSARIEALVGGKRPKDPEEPWPTRVWLAEEGGGYLLKLEGETKGKPQTLLEVTELTFAKPAGAPLQPPSECIATNSEMTDAGDIRSRAEGSVDAQASGTVDLGTGRTAGTATVTEGTASRPGALSKLDAVILTAAEEPDSGPCGTKLKLTATLSVDGPATIAWKVQPGVGGVSFPNGQDGTVILDAAGSTTISVDAIFPRSLKGKARLQAQVKGTKGHDGPLKSSDAVPFEVTCKGR
jgi:hypothetical protein